MVDADELKKGQFYFLLLFYPSKIEIPYIKTYMYIGKNLYNDRESSGHEWYFQDPRSYLEHGSFLQFSEEIEHEKFLANKDVLFQMYDLKGLVERLSKIEGMRK